jgi:hypothetical protein
MGDTRLQVDLDDDTLTVLDQLMIEARRSEGNRKIGTGTMAARLLRSLTTHPEMIRRLLVEAQSTVEELSSKKVGRAR